MTSGYSGDITPILEAIADRAARLCESPDARIFVVDGSSLRYVAGFGEVPFPIDPIRPLTRGLSTGRAVIDRAVVHIEDIAAEKSEFPEAQDYQRRYGHRTTLTVPLLRGDKALGVILLRRSEVRPFNPQHIELVKAFADQAAAAIENLQLSTELKTRNAELTESLEQQTATAEILKVISNSPTNIQPVLDAVTESAARLCGASDAIIRLVDGDVIRVVAHHGAVPIHPEGRVRPLDKKIVTSRAIRERRTIHVHDMSEPWVLKEYPDVLSPTQERTYIGTLLVVPLLREDTAIGTINIRRPEVRPFSDKQVKLLETFAAQAAIAIENVRLFNETKEALEQQTVTAEILRVISSSPTDVQPVFDAIVKSGVDLFGGMNISLRLVKGDNTEAVASTIPLGDADKYPIPLGDHGHPSARAILRRQVVQVPDLPATDWISEHVRQRAERRGFRAIASAPLMRESTAIGVINVMRATPGPFTDKQVVLLKTFADQAVIAIENVRLFNETKEALEQQTATAEILKVISSSPTDIQPVLDAVAESAARLCNADDVIIRRIDGDTTWIAAHIGSVPVQPDRGVRSVSLRTLIGAVVRERRTLHIPDVTDPHEREKYSDSRFSGVGMWGVRTTLIVPLLREDVVIGAIAMRRREVRPFSDKQIKLLETFAAQAVIAIENVRLFNETKEALEQQTATAEILKVISSSPTDTQPVFNAIVHSGRQLFRGLNVSLRVVKGEYAVRVASTSPIDDPAGDAIPVSDESFPGVRAMLCREVVQVPDIHAEQWVSAQLKQTAELRGWRAIVDAPMLRENDAIGYIAVTRVAPGPFTEKEIALLKTFADQAVIAIENVRLFNETKEALEQQTAISEILRVISRSPTDVQPVFDAIVRSGAYLFGGMNLSLRLVEGDHTEIVASTMPLVDADDRLPRPLNDNEIATTRAIVRRELVQFPDIQAREDIGEARKERAARRGFRAIVSTPLLRDNEAIGAIAVTRATPGPFTDKQIALLQTFAAQAVIAIENVRLFNETREALEQQTATAEILKVISSSPTEVQPVFDAIVKSGFHLFEGSNVSLRLIKGGGAETVATTRPHHDAADSNPVSIDDDSTPTGRSIVRREVVLVSDLHAAPDWVSEKVKLRGERRGWRAIAVAPMLKENQVIGAISVLRAVPGPFSEKHIALLKTFADQAVIAIENVRLFNETKEALEHQQASADILRIVSQSVADSQPAFEAILAAVRGLFDGFDATVWRVENDMLVAVARGGPTIPSTTGHGIPITPDYAHGIGVLERRPIRIDDVSSSDEISEISRNDLLSRNRGALLLVPFVRDGECVGAVSVSRTEPYRFSEKQVALLESFASQAVIAIENVRLFNETKEALERQTATAEILKVISSSPTDTQPVFEAIVKSGAQLFRGKIVSLRLVNGDVSEMAASTDPAPRWSIPLNDDKSVTTRAIRLKTVVQVPDIFAEEWIGKETKQRARERGFRAIVTAPMLKHGVAIGAISVMREAPGPFSDHEVALLKTFADQAVIAIENVRLFNETKEALEQQTAISEILRVISDSPTDVRPVLAAVATRAARICDAVDANIFLVEGGNARHAAQFGEMRLGVVEGAARPLDRGWATTTAILDRVVVHVEDMAAASEYPISQEITRRSGARTTLIVPLMRENRALGAIVLRRLEVRPFSDRQVALLKTFADQAAIAIENVRLFNETKDALEQQTATAGILKVISGSPTDTQPVFDAIVRSCTHLFSGMNSTLRLVRGDHLDLVASTSPIRFAALQESTDAESAGLHSLPLDDDSLPAVRAVLRRELIQISDALAEEWVRSRFKQRAIQSGFRSVMIAPMLREGNVIGTINVTRSVSGTFTDKEVALLKTFADQAVIAIENVRLFNEIQEKGRQLEAANKHKSDFLANMSHELRTPLNAVIGFSEALIEKMFGELNAKQEDYLRDIHSSGRHLLSLINDILDLSKIEAGRMELELSEFSVPMALKNALSLVRGRAETHGIALKLRMDPKLGEIRADERKFKQIVVNLLSNAVKFTPDGGHVLVNARMNKDSVKVSVKDDGIGIAQKDQAALFEAFRQVGRKDTGTREGTGLGLALTRRFVELHGGRIALESQPGKGSTFTVTLPVKPGGRPAVH